VLALVVILRAFVPLAFVPMPFDLLIRNASVVTPEGVHALDLAIEDGVIVDFASEIHASSREEIDATGLHVFPGVIDPHVHFNEPGRTEWEGFDTGSAALAAGGGTCFFDMPLNSSPPTLDGPSFDLKLEAALAKSRTDFALWGGLTPRNLDRMEELAERGVVGFKAFMCPSGIDDFEYADFETLEKGMQIAAKLGLIVAVHAEDPQALAKCRGEVTGNDWRAYLKSRPVVCESVAALLAIETARATGCRLHIVHMSDSHVVDIVRRRREQGVDVTGETCPHYLLLNESDVESIGARAKCAPPIRAADRVRHLQFDVEGGYVDFIASDHSPAPDSMKRGDDAFAIWGGIAGVQSTLGTVLNLWERRNANADDRRARHVKVQAELAAVGLPLSDFATMSLQQVAGLTSGNVAARFGTPRKGRVERGFDADLTLVDLSQSYTLTREMLFDRHKLSPYVGRTFKGVVKRTIVRGHTVFRDGKLVDDGFRGRLVRPAR
jgi:allantoinase